MNEYVEKRERGEREKERERLRERKRESLYPLLILLGLCIRL